MSTDIDTAEGKIIDNTHAAREGQRFRDHQTGTRIVIITIIGSLAIAAIISALVIGHRPGTRYFEGIKIYHVPNAGYLYRFNHDGLIQDGFYSTSSEAILAGREHHKRLTGVGK